MAISKTRIRFLDKENKILVKDFKDITSNSIFSDILTPFLDSDFLKQFQELQSLLDLAEGVRDIYNLLSDLSLADFSINNILKSINFTDPALAGLANVVLLVQGMDKETSTVFLQSMMASVADTLYENPSLINNFSGVSADAKTQMLVASLGVFSAKIASGQITSTQVSQLVKDASGSNVDIKALEGVLSAVQGSKTNLDLTKNYQSDYKLPNSFYENKVVSYATSDAGTDTTSGKTPASGGSSTSSGYTGGGGGASSFYPVNGVNRPDPPPGNTGTGGAVFGGSATAGGSYTPPPPARTYDAAKVERFYIAHMSILREIRKRWLMYSVRVCGVSGSAPGFYIPGVMVGRDDFNFKDLHASYLPALKTSLLKIAQNKYSGTTEGVIGAVRSHVGITDTCLGHRFFHYYQPDGGVIGLNITNTLKRFVDLIEASTGGEFIWNASSARLVPSAQFTPVVTDLNNVVNALVDQNLAQWLSEGNPKAHESMSKPVLGTQYKVIQTLLKGGQGESVHSAGLAAALAGLIEENLYDYTVGPLASRHGLTATTKPLKDNYSTQADRMFGNFVTSFLESDLFNEDQKYAWDAPHPIKALSVICIKAREKGVVKGFNLDLDSDLTDAQMREKGLLLTSILNESDWVNPQTGGSNRDYSGTLFDSVSYSKAVTIDRVSLTTAPGGGDVKII